MNSLDMISASQLHGSVDSVNGSLDCKIASTFFDYARRVKWVNGNACYDDRSGGCVLPADAFAPVTRFVTGVPKIGRRLLR
jgi:hypothetical protein